MITQTKEFHGVRYVMMHSDEIIIADVQTSLDWLVNVLYETGCHRIALNREAFAPSFFVLRSGLAGDILQKFVNYHIKLAIIGDYTPFTSKPLHDFMLESNRGNHIYFVSTEAEAAAKLCT